MPMPHLCFCIKMTRERGATSTSTITWAQHHTGFRLVSAWLQELQAPATESSKKLDFMLSGVGLGWGGKPDCPNFWFLEKTWFYVVWGGGPSQTKQFLPGKPGSKPLEWGQCPKALPLKQLAITNLKFFSSLWILACWLGPCLPTNFSLLVGALPTSGGF